MQMIFMMRYLISKREAFAIMIIAIVDFICTAIHLYLNRHAFYVIAPLNLLELGFAFILTILFLVNVFRSRKHESAQYMLYFIILAIFSVITMYLSYTFIIVILAFLVLIVHYPWKISLPTLLVVLACALGFALREIPGFAFDSIFP